MHRALPLLLAVAVAVTACGAPSGTDGDLTNGWPTPPSPSYLPPKQGDCLTDGAFTAFEQPKRRNAIRTDCAQPHTVEVVATGTTASAAWDDDETRRAYAACDAAASAYVGGDWHTGRLLPYLSIPDDAGWQGGVRTWVCGLAEAADDLFAPKTRTGSLRGGIAQLALTCVDLEGDSVSPEGFYRSVDAVLPVSCTDAHDTEFVGVWVAPAGPNPPDAQTVTKACFQQTASFIGLTELQLYTRKDVYTFWDGLTPAQWRLGDRTAHCFLNVSTAKPLHASLKGLAMNPLPG